MNTINTINTHLKIEELNKIYNLSNLDYKLRYIKIEDTWSSIELENFNQICTWLNKTHRCYKPRTVEFENKNTLLFSYGTYSFEYEIEINLTNMKIKSHRIIPEMDLTEAVFYSSLKKMCAVSDKHRQQRITFSIYKN